LITVKFKDKKDIMLKIAEEGISLREFSRKSGISQGYLSQLLSGERKPSPVVAKKLAESLGLNMKDIFLIEVIDKTIN
jgi:transcriptional regulator with XRE-family HTH domain